MAATNKSLARSNKSATGSNATSKRPAARRNSSERLRVWQDPFAGSALPVFYRPLVTRAEWKLNMNWHNLDLYFFLCLLAGPATLLAIIYECMRRFRRRLPVLDGLQRDHQSGAADEQFAREFRAVFNMTSQARKEAMIEDWMRRKGCSRSEAMRLAVEEWRGDRQREQARKREQEEQQRRCNSSRGNLSPAQAFDILGLEEGATEQQVRAAYYRLMKRAHPDVSGSDYFAKQLNGARDHLLAG